MESSQPPPDATELQSYVVYAKRSLRVDQGADVSGGLSGSASTLGKNAPTLPRYPELQTANSTHMGGGALQPGHYGQVDINNGETLDLSASGRYEVRSLRIHPGGVLHAAAGAILIIDESLQLDDDSAVTSEAAPLQVDVHGRDADGIAAVQLNRTKAHVAIAASNGTIAIGANAIVVGALAGLDVRVSANAHITHDGGVQPTNVTIDGRRKLDSAFLPHSEYVNAAADGTERLSVAFSMESRNSSGLRADALSVADPNSRGFRKFVSVKQFADSYGALPSEATDIEQWLQSNGVDSLSHHDNLLTVIANGRVADLERALNVNFELRKRDDGSLFPVIDRVPTTSLPGLNILRVSGIDLGGRHKPAVGGGSGPGGTLVGLDYRRAYINGCQNITGTGETVGIIAYGINSVLRSDITAYENIGGLSTSIPINFFSFPVGQVGQTSPGDQLEETGDVDYVISMAIGATVNVYETNNVCAAEDQLFSIAATAVPLAHELTTSWGVCGVDSALQQSVYEFALQGQSFSGFSGDNGLYDGTVGSGTSQADPLMTLDGITIVGGTSLLMNSPGVSFKSEPTWDHSGGGVVGNAPIPDYQKALVIPSGSAINRNAPDVAMNADNLLFFVNGMQVIKAGTSASSPLWAGFMALVNQVSLTNTGTYVGFANPALYAIGTTPGVYASSFNDSTTGRTGKVIGGVFTANAGVPAGTGYDLATGWGTPKCGLITQLASPTPTLPTSFSQVELRIETGTDDLRDDSEGWAQIFINGQTNPILAVQVKAQNQKAWENGSVHSIIFPVPASVATIPSLSKVVISLVEHDTGVEVDDKWNITRIAARIYNPGSNGLVNCQAEFNGTTVDATHTATTTHSSRLFPGNNHLLTGCCKIAI